MAQSGPPHTPLGLEGWFNQLGEGLRVDKAGAGLG